MRLYYYGARYYSPEIGRFISADTVLDGLNRYAYCGNNPVRYVDPTGHLMTGIEAPYQTNAGTGNQCPYTTPYVMDPAPANNSTSTSSSSSNSNASLEGSEGSESAPTVDDKIPSTSGTPAETKKIESGGGNNDSGNQNDGSDNTGQQQNVTTPSSPSLRDVASGIAWERTNWSNPQTHDWSCHRVMVQVFKKWGIPIGPIASANPKGYYDKFMKDTEQGKHSATYSDGTNTLRVTLLKNPVDAQNVANNSKKGQSIVITTRIEGIGHLQTVVPETSRSVDEITKNGAWVVQGGFASDEHKGKNYGEGIIGYTMTEFTSTWANHGYTESPSYWLIEVVPSP